MGRISTHPYIQPTHIKSQISIYIFVCICQLRLNDKINWKDFYLFIFFSSVGKIIITYIYIYIAWRCMLLLMLNILWAFENSSLNNLFYILCYSTLCNLTIKNDEKQIFLLQLRSPLSSSSSSFPTSVVLFKLKWHHIYDLWIHTISLRA